MTPRRGRPCPRRHGMAQNDCCPRQRSLRVLREGGVSAIELSSRPGPPNWLEQLHLQWRLTRCGDRARGEYLALLGRLRSLAGSAAPRCERIDSVASPTLCVTAPLTSEIGEAQSCLNVNRRIVRNTAAVNYLGLCVITLPIGCNLLPPWAEKQLPAIGSAQSACSAALPSGSHPRQHSRREIPRS